MEIVVPRFGNPVTIRIGGEAAGVLRAGSSTTATRSDRRRGWASDALAGRRAPRAEEEIFTRTFDFGTSLQRC
ncbi:hypothetical protein AB0J74_10915 [Asanoa sp. NPDC049573]|uniref:hypothetical protein n=1 Tax=Asanoa sp. NPDC049573 TaxID=3155396 RepID=UPI003413A438